MVSSGELSDWEEVQYPHNSQPSSPSAQEHPINLKLAIQENFYDDSSSVFPPSEHENLPVESKTYLSSSSSSTSSSSELPLSESETGSQQQEQVEPDSKLTVMMGEVKAGICTMGRRISVLVASCLQSRWRPSVVPAAALAVLILACVKILQWRNRVLLLMREKDQRISQLLNHIAHMNEILSARRRVPVLRIN